ncbi:unnamed protein product, partial [Scytosiphon promiscuus]
PQVYCSTLAARNSNYRGVPIPAVHIQGGITAVLGPSSGGKSVLMKVLTGRLPTVQCTGEVSAPRH